jgi:Fic family protein
VGEHDRETRLPIPDHISARAEGLQPLIAGMAAFDRGAALSLDAVIAAAILAFGFVYVHPFVDGNGRIHRYLIHHVLAQRGFQPAGVVFPVSVAILARIDEYRATLEDYSKRLLPSSIGRLQRRAMSRSGTTPPTSTYSSMPLPTPSFCMLA